MGVNLCRLDAGVTQHFLDIAKVGTARQQVRREAVPQRVRADVGIDTGSQSIIFDQSPELNAIDGIAAAGEEQFFSGGTFSLRSQVAAKLVAVSQYRLDRPPADRDDPLFSAFSLAPQLLVGKLQVTGFQRTDFRGPTAGRVQHLEHRDVALPIPIGFSRRRQEGVDLAAVQHPRHPLPHFLSRDQLGRILLHDPLELQELEERAHRDDVAGDRCGSQFFGMQRGDVVGQVGDGQIAESSRSEPTGEPLHVAAVSVDRIGCQVALSLEVADKIVTNRLSRARRFC